MVAGGILERIDREKIRFVDVDGIRSRYYEEGNGIPLVLVHGGDFSGVSTFWTWSRNVPALSSKFHIYALDKLGQGFTENPKLETDYTFEALFQHFLGFLRAVGVTSAHFVGHSRGAFLVTWLALEHPEMVRTLVIVDSNTTAPDDPDAPGHKFYVDVDRRTSNMPLTKDLIRVQKAFNSWGNAHLTEDLLDQLHEIALLPKTQEAQRIMKAGYQSVWLPSLNRRRYEALERIRDGGVQVPTVVIWGVDDPSASLQLGQRLFAQICRKTDHASMHVLNHAGHFAFREQPHAFNRLLLALCDE